MQRSTGGHVKGKEEKHVETDGRGGDPVGLF